MISILSPTGRGIRGTDKHGSGAFGAPRGSRTHAGVDFIAEPNQLVVAPFNCTYERIARPYGDGNPGDMGLMLRNVGGGGEILMATLFYVHPLYRVIGDRIWEGDPLGIALSLQDRYPFITDHVHLALARGGVPVDPTPFIESSDA